MKNILIVEDHPLFRETLVTVAKEVFEASNVEIAASLEDAIEKAKLVEDIDLVLLDLGLPDCSGVETLRRFRRAQPALRVVVICEIEDASCVIASIEGGAAGYVPKAVTRPILAAALRLVAVGGTYVPRQAIPSSLHGQSAPRNGSELTVRQLDVLRLIVRGLANKEIASKLRIAEDTVKQHARAAYSVLGVSSRTQAMTAVTRMGISFD